MPRANADQPAELTALEKTTELLDVAPKAMIVSNYNLAVDRFGRFQNALDTADREGEGSLAQHVNLLLQCAEYMRFVEMIRSRNDDGVDLFRVEQLVHVREYVRHPEPLREGAGFRPVVVTYRYELRALDSRENRQMRELRNGACAYEPEADGQESIRSTVVPW